ncbi:MAG: hypothetical protein II840_03670 [Kiritimatiellae bacterium]|nr:hypothetical protein [Kiritimatiellia bacterium]
MKKLTQGATRLLVLALGLGLMSTAWAATAPSITVDGANVTVHNDNGTQWDNAGINTMSLYQDTTFTIPSGTDLASGTKVLVSTISIGASSSQPGNLPAKLSLTVGGTTYVSKTATVTAGGFSSSGKNKHTYSFDGKYCILTVGTAVSLKWINEDGSELQGFAAFGLVKDGHQFITRIKWSTSVPVTEITGKIVTVATGALTDIYNRDATPKCLQDATGWISTSTTSTNEVILLNGSNGYGLRLTNGNSMSAGNPNNFSVWPKLSGNGTLTTGDNNWQTPALKIYDASDFTGSINASGGNIYLAVIFCAENDTFSPSVYGEVGSKSGLIYIKSGTSVTVAEGATWTAVNGIVNKGNLTVNGNVASAISNVGGTVTVNEGATLASFGPTRDFTGVTVDSSVAVKITMTAEEYGKGSLNISGASGISSITVLAPDGTTVVTTLTPEDGAAAYNRGTVLVSGKACWCDYEMDYVNGTTTGFENTGTESTGLHEDSSINGDSAFYNGMLYTYAHPYRDPITYPSDGNWTAVVRCTVPAYENAAVITFGTRGGGLIGLVAGADPETQMRLVQTTGNSHFITNATMTVQNATTAQHVYIFSVENNQTVKVYCDGELVLNKTFDSQFSIGNGLQIGSVCGGVGATGIIRFAKDESPANTLDEAVQKNARIDCVRLYNYIISPEQVAQLSVEFPAVKLYRATVANGATTDWGSLTWTPAWDGGNASSKIILTVEGDASLTLTNSITADEFVINVPSANVLTLSKFASGTTLNVTKPIEVSGGTIFFNPGIGQPIGLGNLNFGGTGTVRLGGGIINESISGSASVELLSGVSAIMYGGSIANPLKGAGLLDYSYGNSLPSGLSFGDWTGTVKLPGFTADALNLNSYGKSGSVVEITAVNGGWIAEAGKTVAPTLKLSGNMTIDAMSSWTYTFAEITGSGNLSFSTSGNSPTVNITKVAEGYSGTISSTLANPVTIATLDRAADTPVTAGSKLLNTSSGVQASALTLAGAATSISPVFDTDGLYVKAASVTKNDATANYDTVSAAMTAAGNDAATIKLLMPTDNAIALAPGQTLMNGNLTTGGVTGPNGYEVVNNNGTYTLVDNTASTWAPGEASDNSWNTGANWSTGFKPTQYTSVTFPANVDGWTVGIPGNAGNEKCASMTLNGDVTFQRGGSDWAKLCVYGAISGNGTLTLNQTCIENDSGSVITIPGPVAIVGSNDSAFLGANGWTIAGALSVGGYFKTQAPITVTGNAEFAASGAKVETQAAITITGTTTLNGDFSRDVTYGDAQLTFGDVTVAASTAITGAKPTTFSGTVTLASGATLTVPTATTTVSGATFATSVADSYVKATEDGSTTIYSVAAKRTVTVSTDAHSSVTGVTNGQKFVPGDVLTIMASADTYYTPTLTVNSVAQTSPYELTTTDADVTVSVTATLDTYTITIPSVANTTVSVSYTSGGEAQVATAAGAITVDAGTSLTATWTAVSGYRITANAGQTINPVVATQTLTSPTVEEMSAVVSNVNFTYGADYTTAEVTATITGEATSATLSYGGNTYNAQVSNGTATFTDVAVSRDSGNIYAPVSYTITTDAHATTGGSGSAVAADTTAWFSQSSANSGNPVNGSWTTAVNLSTPTNVTDNTFAATSPSTSSRVVLEFNVCFSSTSDEDVSGEAQAAIKLAEVNSVTTFMVLTNGNNWAAVSNAELTPDASVTYNVVLTIDYGTGTYKVDVAGNSMTNSAGSASFPLAASRTSVQNIDFAGSGTLTSLKGDQVEGYMVKDGQNNYYATIQAAIQAYNSANGPYTVLHNGTPPSGWKIVEGALIKVAKGLFFMAY